MQLLVDGLYVQVAGVTSEEEALVAIGLGADAVAFDLSVSSRQISDDLARDIVRRLPPGTFAVGCFRHELPQRVVDLANRLGLAAVQLEGSLPQADLSYVSDRVNSVLRVLPDGAAVELPWGADYLVLPEVDHPAALDASRATLAASSPSLPIIASGGLTPETVVSVVQDFPVFGVSLLGGVESRVGVKDPALLADAIAGARWAYDHANVERHFGDWAL